MDLYIEYVPLSELKCWPRNPKLHADELEDSITEFGFVDPIILDEGTRQIVSGHGRLEKLEKMQREKSPIPKNIKEIDDVWLAPVVRGVNFESPEAAEKFLLSVNLLPQAGGWDEDTLADMLKDVTPFGVDVAFETMDIDIPDIGIEDSEVESEEEEVKEEEEEEHKPTREIDPLLDGVRRLEESIYFFPEDDKFAKECVGRYVWDSQSVTKGPNTFGIPNIRPDLLIEELPEKLKVWGGRKSTPDDGESTYLWNYGAVPEEGLPYERSILSFFTHDNFINPWWIQTSYHAAKYIKDGGSMVIAPDCSIWTPQPNVLQMLALYKSNWMARWFQETEKLKIIPRLEFFVKEAMHFSLSGIPFDAPIVATQMHTSFPIEDMDKLRGNLEEATKLIRCKKLLVYVSEKGRELVEGTDLKCDVVMLETAKKFRAPRDKETDEELIKLKKERRKNDDPGFISNPEL